MDMTRKFKTVDYEATLNMTVSLREVLPPNHLARFVADVIAQLDLSSLYARYGTRGGEPFAPELLLELEHQLRAEVDELFALSEQADHMPLPEGLVLADEIARRQERLANLAQAKA